MEDSQLSCCEGPDAGTRFGVDVSIPTTPQIQNLGHAGAGFAVYPDPSAAELAQCQAEMGSLLTSIAELNKKIVKLKAPSEPEDFKPQRQSRPLMSGLWPRRLISQEKRIAASTKSKPPLSKQEDSRRVWCALQGALSVVENSISWRRTWAAPITVSDKITQTKHLTAARATTAQASQILDEMEREFGISCPSSPPTEKCHQNQEVPPAVRRVEEEMSDLWKKLEGLHKAWRSGSCGTSKARPLSPELALPIFPGSPLLLRRPNRAFTAPSIDRDVSPAASTGSPSPFSSPSLGDSHSRETERLRRCIERLRARNERLTAALEHRNGESEQICATEDSSDLQMALDYCKECEEAYTELLSLYEGKKQQSIELWRDSTEPVSDRQQPDYPTCHVRNPETDEASTSFSTAGGTMGGGRETPTGQSRSELAGREAALRQHIERLKRDCAAACLPKPAPGGEGKLSPESGTLLEPRGGFKSKDNADLCDTRTEKPVMLHELLTGMELPGLQDVMCHTEEQQGLTDRYLMDRDAAGALLSESPQAELQSRKAEQQTPTENVDLPRDVNTACPRHHPSLGELQTVFQRERGLRKRLCLVRESLDTALQDSASPRKDSEEHIARLAHAHRKAVSAHRNTRRRYREQVWRLEQKMAAMSESHQSQIGALKETLEALECRREETIL